MTSLISSLTSDLLLSAPIETHGFTSESSRNAPTESEESLSRILLQVNQSLSLSSISKYLEDLQRLKEEGRAFQDERDQESRKVEQAVCAKVAIRLYEEALSTLLNEALEVERELQWWNEIERGRSYKVALYLLQSMFISEAK